MMSGKIDIFMSCLGLMLIVLVWLLLRRRLAYYQLSSGRCNLPTVLWTPRFLNYNPISDDTSNRKIETRSQLSKAKQKMGSSAITNILPRMRRLGGPYGMYATVYGVSTKVIHVAHPIPAKYVLMNKERKREVDSTSCQSFLRSILFMLKSRRKGTNENKPIHGSGSLKSPAYDHFRNFSGDGVFTADGDIWRKKRSSVVHCLLKGCAKDDTGQFLRLEAEANKAADMFIALIHESTHDVLECDGNSVKKFVNIVPILQRCTVGLIYRLITHHDVDFKSSNASEIILQNAKVDPKHSQQSSSSTMGTSKSQCDFLPVDSMQHTKRYEDSSSSSASSTSSCKMEQDIDFNTLNTKEKITNISTFNYKVMSEEMKNCAMLDHQELISSYLQAITHIRMIILAQSRSIWYLLPRWIYRTFSPMYHEEERQMQIIRQFARSTCQHSLPGSPLHMLRYRKSHNTKMDEQVISGNLVSKELLEEAITLLFAGQDTSAATLSWTLHLLSLHPRVKKKLFKEVCSVIDKPDTVDGSGMSTLHVTKKMISKMQYLDAVIKESMRLYPVAPFVVRRLPQDLTFEKGDKPSSFDDDEAHEITMPENTFVCIWIYSLHRNEKLWHQPNEFKPERWIDPKLRQLDDAQVKYNMGYMPFAAGPRNCVGQPLAHVILRIILAKIVYSYDFSDEQVDQLSVDWHRAPSNQESKFEKDKTSFTATDFTDTHHLRKDMQAGFTILPSGGVWLSFKDPKSVC